MILLSPYPRWLPDVPGFIRMTSIIWWWTLRKENFSQKGPLFPGENQLIDDPEKILFEKWWLSLLQYAHVTEKATSVETFQGCTKEQCYHVWHSMNNYVLNESMRIENKASTDELMEFLKTEKFNFKPGTRIIQPTPQGKKAEVLILEESFNFPAKMVRDMKKRTKKRLAALPTAKKPRKKKHLTLKVSDTYKTKEKK